jgi:hypothetical protein
VAGGGPGDPFAPGEVDGGRDRATSLTYRATSLTYRGAAMTALLDDPARAAVVEAAASRLEPGMTSA